MEVGGGTIKLGLLKDEARRFDQMSHVLHALTFIRAELTLQSALRVS